MIKNSVKYALAPVLLTLGLVASMAAPAGAFPGPLIWNYPPTVSKGNPSNSPRVVQAVQNLFKNELRISDTDPDGYFGDSTLTDVQAAQYACRIKIDGIVGPDTWKCVYTIVSAKNSGHSTAAPATSSIALTPADSTHIKFKVNSTPTGCAYDTAVNLSTVGSASISVSAPHSNVLASSKGHNVIAVYAAGCISSSGSANSAWSYYDINY